MPLATKIQKYLRSEIRLWTFAYKQKNVAKISLIQGQTLCMIYITTFTALPSAKTLSKRSGEVRSIFLIIDFLLAYKQRVQKKLFFVSLFFQNLKNIFVDPAKNIKKSLLTHPVRPGCEKNIFLIGVFF